MEIIRHDRRNQTHYDLLCAGDCFVLPKGDAVYMKTNYYQPGPEGAFAVNLGSGTFYSMEPKRPVVKVKAVLHVDEEDC